MKYRICILHLSGKRDKIFSREIFFLGPYSQENKSFLGPYSEENESFLRPYSPPFFPGPMVLTDMEKFLPKFLPLKWIIEDVLKGTLSETMFLPFPP